MISGRLFQSCAKNCRLYVAGYATYKRCLYPALQPKAKHRWTAVSRTLQKRSCARRQSST
jgi:hypothetical protein